MTEGTKGKDQSLQIFHHPQRELLEHEDNPFRKTLELMQRNGTDKDTIKAYVACVYATELMLEPSSENRLSYPGAGEIPVNLFDPYTALLIKGMGRIRFIKGGPREYFDRDEALLDIFDVEKKERGRMKGREEYMRIQDVTSGVIIELSQHNTAPSNRINSWEDYYPSWEDYVKDDPYYSPPKTNWRLL